MTDIMKALILCGGLGTRLRSVISDVPKAMAPVGGKPFLLYQINWLKKYQFTDIVLCVGYKAEHIKNYFGDGSRFGVSITYSQEEELLGTGGAIKLAEPFVQGTFLVLNGDTYAKIDFSKLLEFHRQKQSQYTLGLTKVNDPARYGSVALDQDSRITAFFEKQAGLSLSENYINGGVYVFEPDIFKHIPYGKKVSLEQEIIPRLLENRFYGHVWEGSFIDMGVPDSYQQLQNEVLESLFVLEDDSLREVMLKMDQASLGIALVVDQHRKLQGLVTDGDVRRFIIQEADLQRKIKDIMVKNPVTASVHWPSEKIQSLANPRIRHIPLLDDEGKVVDIMLSADLQGRGEAVTVRAKAPLRISFAGGGTDIYHYFKDAGGYVVNSTIDKYCRGTLIKKPGPQIMIFSADFGVEEKIDDVRYMTYDGPLALVKAVIKLMKPSFGFELHLSSDVPPGTGLGSSAAIAAIVASLLNRFREEQWDDYQLAEIIYKAEREELNIQGGWQDQYATIFGGFNFMEFRKEEIIVHPLRVSSEIIEELNNNLFLCYTGKTRSSGDIQARLAKKQDLQGSGRDEEVRKALERLKEITLRIKSALLKGRMQEFGELLHEGWENKKRLDSKISDDYINTLYDIGIKNGALGGKILGAGGGGYLLFFCSPLKKKIVATELEKAGGQVVDFNFDLGGVTSWMVRKQNGIV